MHSLTLRQATRQDRDFLYDLLKATMREYVAQIWGWDEGRQLIRSVMADAFERGLPVALRVLRTNHPAKRLYERLGFKTTGETETHYLMKARPLD
jgi:RimJ/RimL family protein N-acetyltransferase